MHRLGLPQETNPEPTIYRHLLSDRIMDHAFKDGTIVWVDSLTEILYFEIDLLVLVCYSQASLGHPLRDHHLKVWPRDASPSHSAGSPLTMFFVDIHWVKP